MKSFSMIRVSGRGVAVAVGLAALSGGLAAPAEARDYTRSCSAQYGVSAVSPRGTGLERTFSGRGTVGAYMPNTARERARRNIDECITAHWENRFSGTRPAACTEANQVYGYPFRSLHAELANAICAANPGHNSIRISINVIYSGDTGCYLRRNEWMRRVVQDYELRCANLTYERETDRPGSDYDDFNLSQPRWQLCQARCEAEDRCQAWTYVRPGVQGAQARCWLKDAVPPRRPSDCCVSGVKSDLH